MRFAHSSAFAYDTWFAHYPALRCAPPAATSAALDYYNTARRVVPRATSRFARCTSFISPPHTILRRTPLTLCAAPLRVSFPQFARCVLPVTLPHLILSHTLRFLRTPHLWLLPTAHRATHHHKACLEHLGSVYRTFGFTARHHAWFRALILHISLFSRVYIHFTVAVTTRTRTSSHTHCCLRSLPVATRAPAAFAYRFALLLLLPLYTLATPPLVHLRFHAARTRRTALSPLHTALHTPPRLRSRALHTARTLHTATSRGYPYVTHYHTQVRFLDIRTVYYLPVNTVSLPVRSWFTTHATDTRLFTICRF